MLREMPWKGSRISAMSVCPKIYKATHFLSWKHLVVLLVKLAEIHELLAFELVDLDAAGALAELDADVSFDLLFVS
jgi:hypothetical protein